MRKLFVILFGIAVIHCDAEQFSLEGTPFHPNTNVEIVFSASVTNVPKNLWVYKVIPQKFSMAAISNLLELCQLSQKNLVKQKLSYCADTNYVCFQTQNEKGLALHTLSIAPNFGWIHYQNNSGNPNDKLEAAPSQKQVMDLAFDILFKAGIDRSQVLPIPKNYSVTTTQRGDAPPVTTARDVFLVRRIDGINERGFSFMASYGTSHNKPKLLSFDLNWRNLSPYHAGKVATTNELADFIRNGSATIVSQNVDFEKLNHLKKLTVTTFFPLYYNKFGFNSLDFEFPFATMDAVAETETGEKLSLTLNTPLITE